ncbi:MAG TPA: hypothetical protein VGG63_02015 [Steroidobacteraceae bacterium]|jgi:hypothetical protein
MSGPDPASLRSVSINRTRGAYYCLCRRREAYAAPKLQQMQRIQHLPRAQQRFVMQVIDAVLAQQGR